MTANSNKDQSVSKYSIFLDDERNPRDVFWTTIGLFGTRYAPTGARTIVPPDRIIVRNYEQFVFLIERNGLPEEVSFDHDLGEGKNGYDCAMYLTQRCVELNEELPFVEVHSKNPVGARRIITALEDHYRRYDEP